MSSHIAATVGPEPDSHAHQAPAFTKLFNVSCEAGTFLNRTSWCNRSCVAVCRAETSFAANAATKSAVRPTLNTASANGTVAGSFVRDSLVEVCCCGTQTIIDGSSSVGIRTVEPATLATTPPSRDAATLSGCPSSSAAIAKISCCASIKTVSSVPFFCACASDTPAIRAAPLKPNPLPIGICERTHNGPVPPQCLNATSVG
ncbi:unannotated protein [freshwater metagenome]|uniref:Unannotated protein n=1 Tax=freshwater metagenome TaxID=449393 RepID=A0A6J7UCK2_9ZZZZ